MKKIVSGFTIVELLIVIIVIAVLATISIAAYNGMRVRADDAKNKSNAELVAEIAETINAETGVYPAGSLTEVELNELFSSNDTAPLPATLSLKKAVAPPAYATALANANPTGNSLVSYRVKTCTVGVSVYYPETLTQTVQAARAGQGC